MNDDRHESSGDHAHAVNGAPLPGDEPADEDLEWPVGFMVLISLAALYLGWRLIQMIGGLLDLIG